MAVEMRSRILDAACRILKDVGPSDLTMEAAADGAGVSRKTIYNYFRNRSTLIEEAVAGWTTATLDELEGIASDVNCDFLTRLNRILERGFVELQSASTLFRRGADADFWLHRTAALMKLRRYLRSFIREIVGSAMEAGLVQRQLDAVRLTLVIVNIVEGLLSHDDDPDDGVTRADLLKDSLKAVLVGILTVDGVEAMRNSPIFA